jgi:Gryzun, putative Golgi trafficking
MVAPLDEEFWVDCTLTSQSTTKVIYLSRANLDIIEKSKVKLLKKVDLGGNSTLINPLEDFGPSNDDAIRLEPGESFQCVYLLRADAANFDDRDIEELLLSNKALREVEQFGELTFGWSTYPYMMSEEALSKRTDKPIVCTMPSPTLTLVDTFLKVTLLNEKELQHGTIYQPVSLNIEVENKSENVIDSEVSIEESEDFYIGGELKTYLALMPGEKYTFHYNVIPLQIGRLSFPKFNIAELLAESGVAPS